MSRSTTIDTKTLDKLWKRHPKQGMMQFLRIINNVLDEEGLYLSYSNPLDKESATSVTSPEDVDTITLNHK
jgi:hypothetical protein|tara:strand:- start:2634 stop:2846 length:213 start_codon:yes stop_codon:yes gene_type:complete